MTKNKLSDLNDHLFAQLERLGDEELTPEQIEVEAKRSEAIVEVSAQILKNADTHMRAAELLAKGGLNFQDALPMPLAVNGNRSMLSHGAPE